LDGVSGIGRVRVLSFLGFNVRDFEAATTNAFANWSLQLDLLPGNNLLRVIASDNAEPANVTVATATLTYLPPPSPAGNLDDPASFEAGANPTELDLHIRVDGGVARLWWLPTDGNAALQTATRLSPANWTDLASGAMPPFIIGLTNHSHFFRLRLE
jgi:hypothetical protein